MPETIIQWASVLFMLVSLYFGLIRNFQVARFKQKYIDALSNYQKKHIDDDMGLDWEAYKLYDQIGYHKPVFMFWKSLEDFVPTKLKKKLGM